MNAAISNKRNINSAFVSIVLLISILLHSFVSHVHADWEEDKELAKKFAPILVLTENPTSGAIGRKVLNPEPVRIMGAESISNLLVHATTTLGSPFFKGPIIESPQTIRDALPPTVRIEANKFAFLREPLQVGNSHIAGVYLDYPGNNEGSWYTAYFPEEAEDDSHAGWRFRNTVYARVFERPDPSDGHGWVVIKYFCFYPFNDWQNNHEGDWQSINVIVTNRDPDMAKFYGIDYMFHGKSITYYAITDSLSSINIRQRISPVKGRYPVAYVSAGGHGHYPTPGNYAGAGAATYDDDLTSHGLVLHPKIVTSNNDIAQSYDLVLLPEPVDTLDNMGLLPEMSWLGADIGWGETGVSSTGSTVIPFSEDGNNSPKGPFYKNWSNIRVNSGDKYSKSKIPYASFHNFPIVGDVTWSGNISLRGDIVIFPGAELTIESGTVIEFEPRTDIHKFPAQGHGVDSRAEIFVYGTLNTEGTVTSPVRFHRKSGTPAQASYAWGGIRIMEGGSVDLDHTTIRDTPPPPPPTGLTAQAGTGQATLRWDAYPVDASITAWQYRLKPEGVGWRDWQTMPNSGPLTAEHTVTGLIDGETTTFLVRAVNPTGAGSASASVSAAIPLRPLLVKPTHTPTLKAHAGDGEVTLRWDEPNAIQCTWQYQQTKPSFLAQSAAWKPIPASKTFTTEHTVGELTNGQTYVFKVRAVNTGGQGPESAAMSVTPIAGGHKVPPQPTGLSVKRPITRPSTRPGQLYVSWAAVSATPVVNGYTLRYQSSPELGAAISPWSDWCILPDAIAAGTTSYTHTGLRGDTLYRYQVRATNAQGQGAWSAAFPAAGLEPNAPTKPPARGPSAPQNLIAAAANESVVLTWQAPVSNGGATITGYRYRYRAAESTRWSPSAEGVPLGQTTSHTVRTLTNGTEYTFEVWAVNKVGNGAAMSVKATPAGVPHAPVLQAFGKNGEVRLNIKLVADNGSPITRTETRVYSVSQGDTTWRTTKGTWAHHSIDPDPLIYPAFFASGQTVSWDALTNGVTYTFEVRSVNGVGTSAIALTKATAGHTTWLSGGLLPLTALGGAGQVVLNWTLGANWQVAQYEVQSRVARSGHGWSVWSPVPGGGAARDTTIAGLLNGTEYEFMVRAVNEKGEPLAASNVVLATPADRPGAPVLTAAGGDGQVVLDWTAAAAHGSAIVRYEMRLRVADSGHGWPEWSPVPGGSTAQDTTVAGLLNGTEYEFAVRAVNGVGAGVAALDTATPQGPPIFSSDSVSYSVPAGSTAQKTLPAAEGADSYETSGTLPGYVAVNTTTRAITIRPENTHVGDAEFIWRARNPHGTDDLTVNITVTSFVETEYAYRAGQTAPLFDASASGPPDHWSSGALTWTDAAPRVWRIGRTRPSGGHWSGWGQLKKYSERPAASATFYQRARSAPATPATQTGTTLATPSTWQTTPPTATDTEGVWTTTANRPQGEFQWIFTTPTQQTPPNIVQAPGLPRHFTADTGSPLTPGSIDLDWDSPTSGGTPTEYRVEYRFASGRWLSGATPTRTNASLVLSRTGARYQFRVRAENNAGNSSWVETTGTTSKQKPTETETAYRLHTSGTTAPSFTASASTVPTGWSSSRQTPNPHARYEWQISRTRPADGSWSNWGSATVVSTYTERQTAFRLHTSGTSAPSFSATASGRPSGWSSSRPTPNPHARYEWQISRTRPADGSWSNWGSATVVSTYTERQTAFRLHTSGTSAPSFSTTASGRPSGWSSSRPTPNPHARYEWQISRTKPTGGTWSNWGSATVISTYTARQTTYRWDTSGTTFPAATIGTDSESLTIKVQRRLVIAPGAPSSLAAAAGFGIGVMAGRIGMPTRRPKSTS